MKKLLVSVVSMALSIMTIQPGYAADNTPAFPKLHMKITNTIKGQHFALCLSNTCYNLAASGKDIYMDDAQINSIIMANTSNLQMYTQAMPASCRVAVKNNQTLTVSGKLVAKKSAVLLNNLKCTVATHA